MQSLFQFFFYSLGFLCFFSCGNKKDAKLPIENRLAGVKLMAKVPGDSKEQKFFVININSSNEYQTGSIQVYKTDALKSPLATLEIPRLATTLQVVGKYLFLTFEAVDDIKEARLGVWEYTSTGDNSVTLKETKFFALKRNLLEDLDESDKAYPLQPISSLVTRDGKKLAITCKKGELIVLDLSAGDDAAAWADPVHVRSYGEGTVRQAMVETEDNFLLLFPALSELTTQRPVGSHGYDRSEIFVDAVAFDEKKPEESFQEGVPETHKERAGALKQKTNFNQLVAFDLAQKLEFKALKETYIDETFWLHFNLENQESKGEEKYLRTNFLRVRRSATPNVFYISHRNAILNKPARHQILKLTVGDLKGLRDNTGLNVGKKSEDKLKFDLLSQLTFDKKPLLAIEDEEGSTLGNLPKEYMFYDFEVLKNADKTETSPPQFGIISYNNAAGYYFLLGGLGVDKAVRAVHETNSIRESYWGLVLWDDNTYVTAKNSYKKEAELVSKKFPF